MRTRIATNAASIATTTRSRGTDKSTTKHVLSSSVSSVPIGRSESAVINGFSQHARPGMLVRGVRRFVLDKFVFGVLYYLKLGFAVLGLGFLNLAREEFWGRIVTDFLVSYDAPLTVDTFVSDIIIYVTFI